MDLLEKCISDAIKLREKTPISIRHDFYDISFKINKKGHKNKIKELSKFYRYVPCVIIPPDHIINQCYNPKHVSNQSLVDFL
jgi:hypothetical protein